MSAPCLRIAPHLSAVPVFLLALLALRPQVCGLTFSLTFDSSVNGAPQGFVSAFDDAIEFYETNFSDPITINLQVGWGEVAGQSVPPGTLGESSAIKPGFFHFDQMKSALISDAKSASDLTSIAYLPASDPTGGATYKLSRSESRALGIISGNSAGLDGSVGFNSGESYTFDPNHRAVPGKVDFIGVAEHEISEVLGRFGLGQNGAASGVYSPLDFFRYTAPGSLDLTPTNGAYFSINGGAAVLNTFNGTGGGDLSDWSGATIDSYNASLPTGVELGVSAVDLVVMDVLGYDRVLPGDFNRDGHVDGADVSLMMQALADPAAYELAKSLSDPQLLLLGDLNGDGVLSNVDLQKLINLLKTGSGSASSVPEPSTLALAALGAVGLLFARRRPV